MTQTQQQTSAAVLSGGGAKGAYEIGVLKALAEGRSPTTGYRPLELEVLTGTSVGAYNASFLAAQNGVPLLEGVKRLEDVWRNQVANSTFSCGNGVYRLRDAPLNVFDPGCAIRPFEVLRQSIGNAAFWTGYAAVYGSQFLTSGEALQTRVLNSINLAGLFSPQPLYELIERTIDLDALRAAQRSLTIAASNFKAGVVELFTKEDITDVVGRRAIAASAAIPGVFPPVDIDGIPFVDGGVTLNTPIRPAIRAGADVLHVIYLDPLVADIPLAMPPTTIDTVYRMFLVMSAARVRADIQTAAVINRSIALHRELGLLSTEGLPAIPGVLDRPNSRILQRLAAGERPYRPLTIIPYRPKTDLKGGDGLLDFSAAFIDQLIELGYQETVDYDMSQVVSLESPSPEPEP